MMANKMWLALLTGAISRTSSRIQPTAAFHHVNFISKLKPKGLNLPRHTSLFSSSSPTGEDRKRSSSYDIDVDEEAEQRLSSEGINGDSPTFSRYSNLVQEMGLDSMSSTLLEDMPHKRPVSPKDIFCNRELKLSAIEAIG